MSQIQFAIGMGIPTMAVLVGILVNYPLARLALTQTEHVTRKGYASG